VQNQRYRRRSDSTAAHSLRSEKIALQLVPEAQPVGRSSFISTPSNWTGFTTSTQVDWIFP
jgi:hypothetical protein